MTPRDDDVLASSGNVFEDLGLPDSDQLIAKAALADEIATLAAQRGLTQAATAKLLGTTQPKVSELFMGKLAGFSMERLIRFLNALDRDVNIVLSPKPDAHRRAKLQVLGGRPRFTAVFEEVPEGYVGYVEELPGATTQAATLEEARTNLAEALELVLDANRRLAEERLDGRKVIREPLRITA